MLVVLQPLASDEWNGEGQGYLLHYHEHGVVESNQSAVINDGNAISFHLTGLQPWTNYIILLAAVNNVGRSNFTEPTAARTHESGLSLWTGICAVATAVV